MPSLCVEGERVANVCLLDCSLSVFPLSVSPCLPISACLCLPFFICLSLFASLSMSVSVCICLCLSVSSLTVYLSLSSSICLSLFFSVCLYLFVCVYLSVCLSVSISVDLSMYVCVSFQSPFACSVCLSLCVSLSHTHTHYIPLVNYLWTIKQSFYTFFSLPIDLSKIPICIEKWIIFLSGINGPNNFLVIYLLVAVPIFILDITHVKRKYVLKYKSHKTREKLLFRVYNQQKENRTQFTAFHANLYPSNLIPLAFIYDSLLYQTFE